MIMTFTIKEASEVQMIQINLMYIHHMFDLYAF